MGQDWDWGFAIAYNAVLQGARALMYARGFRPVGPDVHRNTFAFVGEALGPDFDELVSFFDRMRSKRHQAVYDVAGLITEVEARTLFEEAGQFVDLVESFIR